MSRRIRLLRGGALPLAALLACATPAPRPEPVPVVTPEPPPPPPAAVEAPPPVVAPAPVPAPGRAPVLPATVRIGLRTDLESITLPCCAVPASVELDGVRREVHGPIVVRPADGPAPPAVWRLQVAALREEDEAATLVARLRALGAAPVDARFDAASGLYRVRAGAWPAREAAETAGRTLQGRGLASFWVVSEGAPLVEPALAVSLDGGERRIPGRRFALAAAAGAGLAFEGRRYRGDLVVVLNDRGRLNLVNELPLEDYLRGVVPSELGPDSYPELEALKAQAVAARSYTLRNLGGFADEGYDLCGTPKCQVYGGLGAEHPLSDRAVAETAGEVMVWDGGPIDALYSATCGGHTEDVEVVFPLKRAPYLRGVACLEAGVATLRAPSGETAWPHDLLARAISGLPGRIASADDLERALDRLAAASALTPAPDRLASLENGEVRRFLASRLDLGIDPRIFARPGEIAAAGPGSWSAADRELAAWIAEVAGTSDDGGSGRFDLALAEPLLLRLAQRLGLLERRRAIFDTLRAGDLLVREGLRETGLAVGKTTLAFRAAEGTGATPQAATLALGAGDPVELWLAGGRLAALVGELPAGAPAFDRPHARATWTRFRSDAEIADLVRLRFPGFDFAGLDIVARGPSGRVSRIRLRGADGSSVEVAGLAVRWTLDLPDTLFTLRRSTQRGRRGWLFTGRGWGHGVGLCQYGAWGMARRGLDYRAILAHYYSGATLERLAPAAER